MGCGASNSNSGSVANAQTRPPVAQISNRTAGTPLVSRPLTICPPYRHGAPISQGDLHNQRVEFWTTRTDGNVTMWQSIRSAAEALLDRDTALANAILEATNIISPSGTLEVVYDERGHQYKVPQYCYSVPVELVAQTSNSEQAPVVATVSIKDTGVSASGVSSNSNNPIGGPVGSAGGDPIKLRVRINPGDLNVAVTSDTLSTIYQLKQQIAHDALRDLPQQITAAQLTPERQRVMYLGKQLPDTMKIGEAKFDDTKVVQVFLRPVNSPSPTK